MKAPAALAVAALALIGLAACRDDGPAAPLPSPQVPLPAGLDTRVEKVIDGDTIVVAGGHTVRLIGVDTPETKHPRKPVECFGREAAAFLATVLTDGTGVRLVGDAEQRDVYDRTLAYVYRLPDGMFVNAELVRGGYADVLSIAPNVAHRGELAGLAREARDGGRGLWGACPTPPP